MGGRGRAGFQALGLAFRYADSDCECASEKNKRNKEIVNKKWNCVLCKCKYSKQMS